MAKRRIFFFIFLALTAALDIFIIVESCIPGVGSATQSQGFTQAVIDFVEKINPSSTIGQNPENLHAVIRKLVGHFLLFGLSGILSTLTLLMIDDIFVNHKLEVIITDCVFGLGLASTTELIQYFVPGRAGMLTDIFIDFAGYIIFGFIIYIIMYSVYHHKQKQKLAY